MYESMIIILFVNASNLILKLLVYTTKTRDLILNLTEGKLQVLLKLIQKIKNWPSVILVSSVRK